MNNQIHYIGTLLTVIKLRNYELQKKRKLRSFNAWDSSKFGNISSFRNYKIIVMYILTYRIGLTIVQEWNFHSPSLANYKMHELIQTGRYNDGSFKIERLNFLK